MNVSPALLKKMANVCGAMVSTVSICYNFYGCKNDNFLIKKNCVVFFILAKNIDTYKQLMSY